MAPVIKVSDEVYKSLIQLGIKHKVVVSPKLDEAREDIESNPSDYILLEGKSGKEGYPDLHVCKHRLEASPVIEAVGRNLGIRIIDTAREDNGRAYVGNINREQAVRLNLMLGGRTLNTRQAKDFFKLLLSGKAFDGTGKKIQELKLSQIADEIMQVRSPYRAEWFEDYFTFVEEGLVLNKNYILEEGVLVPKYSAPLITCLMEDRTPGISLDSWLKNSTTQGYPRKNTKSGSLYYYYPGRDSAVGFGAGSAWAHLGCSWLPDCSLASLGVRHVREAHVKNK